MRTNVLVFILTFILLSNGSLAGNSKSTMRIKSFKKDFFSHIDYFKDPSVKILGKNYPINNIDLPVEMIYEEHAKEKLLEILSDVLSKLTLYKKGDSFEQKMHKHIAAGLVSVYFIKSISRLVERVAIDIGKYDKTRSIKKLFKTFSLFEAADVSKEVMSHYQQSDLGKGLFKHIHPRSYRGFRDYRLSAFTDIVNGDVSDTEGYDSDADILSEAEEIEGAEDSIDVAENYILLALIKSMYKHWPQENEKILKGLAIKEVEEEYVKNWVNLNHLLARSFSKDNNPYLNIFKKEIFRFTKNLEV